MGNYVLGRIVGLGFLYKFICIGVLDHGMLPNVYGSLKLTAQHSSTCITEQRNLTVLEYP